MNTSIEKMQSAFQNPDRRYGVFEIVHGAAAKRDMAQAIDELGFAGIVGNVDYDETFPDRRLFDACSDGMRSYFARGMHTWIYDEKGYPSGSAGGYVTENHPEFVAQGLYCYDYWRVVSGPGKYRADVPGDKLWKALLVPLSSGDKRTSDSTIADADPIDVTDALNENNVLYVDVPAGSYYLFMMSIRRLFDGTHATEAYSEPRNYISLSDKEATRAFIACTHEKYKEVLGDEFGKGVLATFTDEPSLISWNIRRAVFPILPWLHSYPADFEKRFGYPLEYACSAVVLKGGKDWIKRRCDFWEFIGDSVADGFFGTIADWAHQNRLKSSGHLLEEESLQAHVYCYGSFFRAMSKLDWPGIDQLNCKAASLMNTNQVPFARFVASFGDLNGEHEVFTEFSDHESRELYQVAPLSEYYGSVNWHFAMGMNNFTSYFSFNGITPAETRAFNQYTARTGTLLRVGKRDSRVAVLYPDAALWALYTPSTEMRAVDRSQAVTTLTETFNAVSWGLIKRQVDVDFIDSRILESAVLKEGKLTWGDRAYDALILPDCIVLQDASTEKVCRLAESGFNVICCAALPEISREQGVTGDAQRNVKALAQVGTIRLQTTDDFLAYLDEGAKDLRGVRFAGVTCGDAGMILSHRRVAADGRTVLFLTNMGDADFEAVVLNPGKDPVAADAHTGMFTEMEPDKNGNVRVTIPAGDAVILLTV